MGGAKARGAWAGVGSGAAIGAAGPMGSADSEAMTAGREFLSGLATSDPLPAQAGAFADDAVITEYIKQKVV
ncbi:hypothetical protein H8E07_20080 [bacterium]|nr:hypothetical protein [bacterium]